MDFTEIMHFLVGNLAIRTKQVHSLQQLKLSAYTVEIKETLKTTTTKQMT